MSTSRAAISDKTAQLLQAMRAARPLVHNIANYVSMDVAANALLAVGASPAMVHAREEVAEFVALSAALVVNIGTLSTAWVEAMILAAQAARRHGRPWVLDPVGAGATRLRTETVKSLLLHRPSIIRGNASEIMAVAGGAGVAPKGVDSANTTEEALAFALSLCEARRLHRHCHRCGRHHYRRSARGETRKWLADDGQGDGSGLCAFRSDRSICRRRYRRIRGRRCRGRGVRRCRRNGGGNSDGSRLVPCRFSRRA